MKKLLLFLVLASLTTASNAFLSKIKDSIKGKSAQTTLPACPDYYWVEVASGSSVLLEKSAKPSECLAKWEKDTYHAYLYDGVIVTCEDLTEKLTCEKHPDLDYALDCFCLK